MVKTENRKVILEMETSIEQLYEKFRLKTRALYLENKDLHGNLNEDKMKSYNALILNIPNPGILDFRFANHQSRPGKSNNIICDEWYDLKSEIDVKMKKMLDQVFDKTEACFCCLKDLSSDDIFGSWHGIPWLCQDEKKPGPPLNIEEIMTKIQKSSCSK